MRLTPPIRKPIPNVRDLGLVEREAMVADGELVRPKYALLSGDTDTEWLRMEFQDDFQFPSRELVFDLEEVV